VDHLQNLLAKRRLNVVPFSFLNYVAEGEIDFSFYALLNLPQWPFAVIEFP
jgi:hypothetical protein